MGEECEMSEGRVEEEEESLERRDSEVEERDIRGAKRPRAAPTFSD